jgi:succinoglycan biosynthesis protein ExoA
MVGSSSLPESRPAMASRPFVTVAMPCLNEEAYIEDCLRSVLSQDYPRDRMEILVADGRSGDRTRDIIARLAEEDRRIRLIDNPERLQAAGMNRVIRAARGDVIVRMDVHCEYAPDYVSACVRVLERTGADNVGGAQRARSRGSFQRALCAALTSPLGMGGASYRQADQEGEVDTVFLGAFRRRVFERVGLYDPEAFTNEDAELNQRIIEDGGRVYLSREITVHYYPRSSLKALARQYYRYGLGRARTIHRRGMPLTVRPLLPFLMVVGGAGLLAIPVLRPLAPLALGAYALATGIEAVRVGRALGPAKIAVVWSLFPTMHVAHGVGMAVGLVRYRKVGERELERLEPSPGGSRRT